MIRRLLELLKFASSGVQRKPGKRAIEPEVLAEPAEPLAPILRDPKDPVTEPQARTRLCIDLGTSSSAVTWAQGENDHLIAKLGFDADGKDQQTIGSSVLWLDEQDEGNESLVMGAENYKVLLVTGALPSAQPITRSLKRMLFDYEMVPPNERARSETRLRAMFRELLLLALSPRHSATLAALTPVMQPAAVERWKEEGGFGLNDRLHRAIENGVEVCLCVPNSFGSRSISVSMQALAAAFDDIRARDGLEDLGVSNVRIVREAEAIAWAARETIKQHHRVLIADVGAGTTDVAVVESRDDLPRLRVRSGIPFGGDDVDQALLVLVANAITDENKSAVKSGAAVVDVVPLSDVPAEWRQGLQEEARTEKERWSSSGSEQVMAPYLLRGTDPTQPYSIQTRAIEHPERSDVYLRFLRYAIMATCGPLLDALRDEQLTVDAVILSGSSSLLPEITSAIQALLIHAGMTDRPVLPISDLLSQVNAFRAISPVRRAKLACAWGAAEASHDAENSMDTRNFVPETILLRHNDRNEVLVEAGTVIADGELTKYFHLDRQRGHAVQFYRYFCLLSSNIEEHHRRSTWVRRMINGIRLPQGHAGLGVRLVLSEQGPSFEEELMAWPESYASRKQMIPYGLTSDLFQLQAGDELNPVTALPMNWTWPK